VRPQSADNFTKVSKSFENSKIYKEQKKGYSIMNNFFEIYKDKKEKGNLKKKIYNKNIMLCLSPSIFGKL